MGKSKGKKGKKKQQQNHHHHHQEKQQEQQEAQLVEKTEKVHLGEDVDDAEEDWKNMSPAVMPAFLDELMTNPSWQEGATIPNVLESFIGENTYFAEKAGAYTTAWIWFFKGNSAFKSAEYVSAYLSYIESLMSLIEISQVLHVDVEDVPEDGIKLFDFHGNYGQSSQTEKESRLIHQIAICMRNTGMSLYRVNKYFHALHFFKHCCEFPTTRMETKSHYWRAAALFKTERYESAMQAVEHAESLSKKKNFSERLLRKNEKMRKSSDFSSLKKVCHRVTEESILGIFELDKMLLEDNPGQDHSEYNVSYLRTGAPKGWIPSCTGDQPSSPSTATASSSSAESGERTTEDNGIHLRKGSGRPGLFADRSYRKGHLILVSKSIFSCSLSPMDEELLGLKEPTHSALFEPIHCEIAERQRAMRYQELFDRFCKYLITKSGKDEDEKILLDETCLHFAERMGAIGADGEIDHEKVAKELLQQDEFRVDLLQGYLNEQSKPPTFKPFEQFCKVANTQNFYVQAASEKEMDDFVEFCLANPGADPTGDTIEKAVQKDSYLKTALLSLLEGRDSVTGRPRLTEPHGIPCTPLERKKIRVASLLFREPSHLFKNGAELLWAKDGCAVEGVDRNVGFWVLPSLMNHSCVPNTTRLNFGDLCFIQAARDISAGEELTVCYSHAVYKEKDVLSRRFGFQCQCEYCLHGGLDAQDAAIQKWKTVMETKVLPKFASAPTAVAQKHVDYAVKLLEKLENLVRTWVFSHQFKDSGTSLILFRVHFLEPYYTFINALEKRSEREFKITALELREKRVLSDRQLQFGLLTLLGKRFITLQNEHENAKILLPMETEVIRSKCFSSGTYNPARNSGLLSGTMRSLLCLLNFPSSQLMSHVHGDHATLHDEKIPRVTL